MRAPAFYTLNSNNQPNIARLIPGEERSRNPIGLRFTLNSSIKKAIPLQTTLGLLNAIDLNKGDLVWRVPLGEFPELKARGIAQTGTENFGGAIVTSGGLVFIGATRMKCSTRLIKPLANCFGNES